jgi:tetratricopeptide (TPR) repeat protein
VLVGQCWQLGDLPLADQLLAAVFAKVGNGPERLPATLFALDYYRQTRQIERADQLLQPLLADKALCQWPWLWRLAAQFAAERKKTVRSFECFERSLDLEYQQLPDVILVEAVRADYGALLAHYENQANALATLQQEPPKDFLPKVIRATDRWRSLDTDGTAACLSAARILKAVGAHDLAWDYLTTPVPVNAEATHWPNLAQTLAGQGDWELADRAYAVAFTSDPANANWLWGRVSCLQQEGKPAEARQVLQHLADGQWQPQYQVLQAEARRLLDAGASPPPTVLPGPAK